VTAKRTRPARLITMSVDGWERLDAIAERNRQTRSATVERLVLEAELPRPREPKR
jgi:macrodomain Ter protein organizer (MatP/YcbG family)